MQKRKPGTPHKGWKKAARARLEKKRLVCVNGHDRCYGIPDPKCPYCERR